MAYFVFELHNHALTTAAPQGGFWRRDGSPVGGMNTGRRPPDEVREYVVEMHDPANHLEPTASALVLAESYLGFGSRWFAVLVYEASETEPLSEDTPTALLYPQNPPAGINRFDASSIIYHGAFPSVSTVKNARGQSFPYTVLDPFFAACLKWPDATGRGDHTMQLNAVSPFDVYLSDKQTCVLNMRGPLAMTRFPLYFSVLKAIPGINLRKRLDDAGRIVDRVGERGLPFLHLASDLRAQRRQWAKQTPHLIEHERRMHLYRYRAVRTMRDHERLAAPTVAAVNVGFWEPECFSTYNLSHIDGLTRHALGMVDEYCWVTGAQKMTVATPSGAAWTGATDPTPRFFNNNGTGPGRNSISFKNVAELDGIIEKIVRQVAYLVDVLGYLHQETAWQPFAYQPITSQAWHAPSGTYGAAFTHPPRTSYRTSLRNVPDILRPFVYEYTAPLASGERNGYVLTPVPCIERRGTGPKSWREGGPFNEVDASYRTPNTYWGSIVRENVDFPAFWRAKWVEFQQQACALAELMFLFARIAQPDNARMIVPDVSYEPIAPAPLPRHPRDWIFQLQGVGTALSYPPPTMQQLRVHLPVSGDTCAAAVARQQRRAAEALAEAQDLAAEQAQLAEARRLADIARRNLTGQNPDPSDPDAIRNRDSSDWEWATGQDEVPELFRSFGRRAVRAANRVLQTFLEPGRAFWRGVDDDYLPPPRPLSETLRGTGTRRVER